MRLDRRSFLVGVGASAGWLATRGLGAGAPASFEETLRALGASLTPGQHAAIVFPADHPSRQINNTFSVLRGPHLGTLLSPGQQRLVRALYESMLSERGRSAFQGTIAVEGRLEGCTLAIYGEPGERAAQAVISGGHLLLRGGGAGDGATLGGGVAYGHQIGDGKWRVPGNSFAYHGDAFQRLFQALSAEERRAAIVAEPPHELLLQPQGAGGRFPGLALARASEAPQAAARELLATVLSAYPEARRAEALSAIEHNGGVGALHVAAYASHGFYPDLRSWASQGAAERERRGDPYWQVWRVEGPGAVIHFKGHPHVHAYLSIVRDPSRANLGESLARTDTTLEGEPMRRLLEAALRRATGETLAFYGAGVPGRFCAGEVTTGLAFALDPYADRVAVATIEGRALSAAARERLAAGGAALAPDGRHRVATTAYLASGRDERRELGAPLAVEAGGERLRDALIAELRTNGLAAAAA
jgi:hypothetical protein